MKYLLKLKWENIMAISLGLSTLYSWFVAYAIKDYRVVLISMITTLCFIVVVISYNVIRDFRKELLKMW